MKKILFLFTFALTLLTPVFAVHALDLGSGLAKDTAVGAGYDKNTDEKSLAELVGTIIKVLLSFTGVIFLFLFFYAGFLWMTARGDEGKIETAMHIITSSMIGLTIAVGAYSVTNFVVPRIVEKTTGDVQNGADSGAPSAPDVRLVGCCEICEVGGVLEGGCRKSVMANAAACTAACTAAGGACQESNFELVPQTECR